MNFSDAMKIIGEVQEGERLVETESGYCSLEEAQAKVMEPVPMPDFARSFFGSEKVERLVQLFRGDFVRNLDSLVLSGEISEEEAMDCMVVMEEFRAACLELERLADQMVESVGPKLPYYLDGVFADRKINLRGVRRLMESVGEVGGSILSGGRGGMALMAMSAMLVGRLMGGMSASVCQYLASKYGIGSEVVMVELGRKRSRDIDLGTMGILSLLSMNEFVWFFRENAMRFESLLGKKTDPTMLERQFKEVRELSQYRTIEFDALREGLMFRFEAPDPSKGGLNAFSRVLNLCAVTVMDPLNPTDRRFTMGLTRFGGDLIMSNSTAERVLGKKVSDSIKSVVFGLLADYLRGKREDIECAPLAPRAAVPAPAKPKPESERASPVETKPEEVGEDLVGNMDQVKGQAVAESRIEVAGRLAELAPAVEAEEPKVVEAPADQGQAETEEARYDRYRVSMDSLSRAIETARACGGRLRVLRVDVDRIYERFKGGWEPLLRQMGYQGDIEWVTMDEVKAKSKREVPLVVPHKMNTHLSEGWKRGQQNVFVIEVSSPKLLLGFIGSAKGSRLNKPGK